MMETVTSLQPIENRQQITDTGCKIKRLQNAWSSQQGERLERSGFIQHSRILKRRSLELLDHMPKPTPSVKTIPYCKQGQFPRICLEVPEIAERDCQPEPERKSLTLEYANTNYSEDQWTHIYADGSAAEVTGDGKGRVYSRYKDEEAHITIGHSKIFN